VTGGGGAVLAVRDRVRPRPEIETRAGP
jgi:hypothetical protein